MAMPNMRQRVWTAAEVRAIPEDTNRYECVYGELQVTPAPKFGHQFVLDGFHLALAEYLRDAKGLTLLRSPADLQLRADSLVVPDLFIARPRDPAKRIRSDRDIAKVALVIEVLSPRTKRMDRGRKRDLYQEVGVEEYWIVDTDARAVERWRPQDAEATLLTERLSWAPDGGLLPLVIDLPTLFARALDD